MSKSKMREALQAFLECPRWVDEATVPKAGIEANPNQVVVNMSVSLTKIRNAEQALAYPIEVSLTDDEIVEAANEAHRALPDYADEQDEIIAVVRACIAAHKAKKNGGET